MQEGELEEFNKALQRKYRRIEAEQQRWEELFLDDARVILVAFGTMSRITRNVVKRLRKKNKRVGFIRPISLWPFPKKAFSQLLRAGAGVAHKSPPRVRYLVVEMSYGQMLEDVKLAVEGRAPVDFIGRGGGGIPSEQEVIDKINRFAR